MRRASGTIHMRTLLETKGHGGEPVLLDTDEVVAVIPSVWVDASAQAPILHRGITVVLAGGGTRMVLGEQALSDLAAPLDLSAAWIKAVRDHLDKAADKMRKQLAAASAGLAVPGPHVNGQGLRMRE